MSRYRSILLTMTLGFAFVLGSGLAHAEQAITQLESLLNNVKTFEADFVEKVPQPHGKSATYQGHFSMQRPGKFNWTVKSPDRQTIISDGFDVWLYDVDLQQVSVTPIGERIGDTPALLLSGDNKAITKEFTVEAKSEEGFDQWFVLKNKAPEGFIREVNLGFVGGEVRMMKVMDGTQAATTVKFKNTERNKTMAQNQFKFNPPKGVDVIGIPTEHE